MFNSRGCLCKMQIKSYYASETMKQHKISFSSFSVDPSHQTLCKEGCCYSIGWDIRDEEGMF